MKGTFRARSFTISSYCSRWVNNGSQIKRRFLVSSITGPIRLPTIFYNNEIWISIIKDYTSTTAVEMIYLRWVKISICSIDFRNDDWGRNINISAISILAVAHIGCRISSIHGLVKVTKNLPIWSRSGHRSQSLMLMINEISFSKYSSSDCY